MRMLAGAIIMLAGAIALGTGSIGVGLDRGSGAGGGAMAAGFFCGLFGFVIVLAEALPRRGRRDDEPPLQRNPPPCKAI